MTMFEFGNELFCLQVCDLYKNNIKEAFHAMILTALDKNLVDSDNTDISLKDLNFITSTKSSQTKDHIKHINKMLIQELNNISNSNSDNINILQNIATFIYDSLFHEQTYNDNDIYIYDCVNAYGDNLNEISNEELKELLSNINEASRKGDGTIAEYLGILIRNIKTKLNIETSPKAKKLKMDLNKNNIDFKIIGNKLFLFYHIKTDLNSQNLNGEYYIYCEAIKNSKSIIRLSIINE